MIINWLLDRQFVLYKCLSPCSSGLVNLYSMIPCLNFRDISIIEAVEGCKVLKAVSFVHDCFSEGCHFEEMVTTVPIEREKVGVNKKVFVHDYSNNLYCFNNYCLNA